jgi:hypothetical protein
MLEYFGIRHILSRAGIVI